MNPLTPYLLWIKIGAAVALLAALAGWHFHAVHAAADARGAQVTAQRDAIDAKNTARAEAELLAENERTRKAQADLAIVQEDLQKLSLENNREKLVSSQRQSDLLAGRERMRILTTGPAACNPTQAGPAPGAGPADVDPGAGLVVDLDPTVAAGLEGIRAQHNEAVRRLSACIREYDGVKAAADAL
jgi:hypothetical protein